MAWMPVLLAEVTDEDVADMMDLVFFLIKWGWLILLVGGLLWFLFDNWGKISAKTRGETDSVDYDEDEEDEEDPWAWKREYDRRRRYEAQREARREERRKSRYDGYGRDEERVTHYGEEHDVDENGYCHDCDCEEDDLI